jgi:anti-sigma-K factor RskA
VTGDPHDLVGAYATDALEPEERAAMEAHLRTCPECQAELAGYREVLAALATRAVAPPPGLEDAVVTAATGPAGQPAASPGRQPTPSPGPAAGSGTSFRRRRLGPRGRSTVLVAAAAAATVFVAGGVVGRATAPTLPVAGDGTTMAGTVLAVATAEDATFMAADVMGADARVVVSDEMGKMALLATDLPTPAKGACYQVWRVAPDGTKSSAGVFTPDADGLIAVVLDAGSGADRFVITTEPPGGSLEPTGQMVGQIGT